MKCACSCRIYFRPLLTSNGLLSMLVWSLVYESDSKMRNKAECNFDLQEKIFILQCRPVTTLFTWSDFEVCHEHDSGFTDFDAIMFHNCGWAKWQLLISTCILYYVSYACSVVTWVDTRRSTPILHIDNGIKLTLKIKSLTTVSHSSLFFFLSVYFQSLAILEYWTIAVSHFYT